MYSVFPLCLRRSLRIGHSSKQNQSGIAEVLGKFVLIQINHWYTVPMQFSQKFDFAHSSECSSQSRRQALHSTPLPIRKCFPVYWDIGYNDLFCNKNTGHQFCNRLLQNYRSRPCLQLFSGIPDNALQY